MKTISVNTEQQKEELMRKVMKTSSLVHTVVCTANDIAHTQMLDTIEHLKDAGMFRRGVKRYAMEALRHYGRYEKISKSDTGDREALHVDYLDFAQESLEADVRNLYFSAKMFLDRRKEDNTAVKADVIAAEALLFSAIRIFDSVMEYAKEKHGYDFTDYFSVARLTKVLSMWKIVSDEVVGMEVRKIEDNNINLAINVIANRITSPDFINRTGYRAIMLDDKLREQFADETDMTRL